MTTKPVPSRKADAGPVASAAAVVVVIAAVVAVPAVVVTVAADRAGKLISAAFAVVKISWGHGSDLAFGAWPLQGASDAWSRETDV